ncbi:CS domain-containing protein [Pycnococcus provasolii]
MRGQADVPRCFERRVDVKYLPGRVTAGDALVLAGWALRETHCCVDCCTGGLGHGRHGHGPGVMLFV